MPEWVDFAEIKRRIQLEPVLRSYGVNWLRRSGVDQYRGRCPIHRGQGQEAFHANLKRGLFHCFACGAGGNVLDFVAAMEGSSIREAALRLQAYGGARLDVVPGATGLTERKLVTEKRSINPPLNFRLDVERRHPYLVQRGIEPATTDHFGVGYYRGPGLMGGRIAIPIHNDGGQLVAYCGRAVDGAEPRYRFPAGFQKSQVLFHLDRAGTAGGDQEVIVVEGFFDCMRVYQAGYLSVVALMGASLSPQKALLAARFRRVRLLLDGDATGRAATRQIASGLEGACLVRPLLLPPGMQPDQMSREEIRQILAEERRSASIAN